MCSLFIDFWFVFSFFLIHLVFVLISSIFLETRSNKNNVHTAQRWKRAISVICLKDSIRVYDSPILFFFSFLVVLVPCRFVYQSIYMIMYSIYIFGLNKINVAAVFNGVAAGIFCLYFFSIYEFNRCVSRFSQYSQLFGFFFALMVIFRVNSRFLITFSWYIFVCLRYRLLNFDSPHSLPFILQCLRYE